MREITSVDSEMKDFAFANRSKRTEIGEPLLASIPLVFDVSKFFLGDNCAGYK